MEEAELWLCPELESWNSLTKHKPNQHHSLRDMASHWLITWTRKYKVWTRYQIGRDIFEENKSFFNLNCICIVLHRCTEGLCSYAVKEYRVCSHLWRCSNISALCKKANRLYHHHLHQRAGKMLSSCLQTCLGTICHTNTGTLTITWFCLLYIF